MLEAQLSRDESRNARHHLPAAQAAGMQEVEQSIIHHGIRSHHEVALAAADRQRKSQRLPLPRLAVNPHRHDGRPEVKAKHAQHGKTVEQQALKPVDTARLVREALAELNPQQDGREIEVRVGNLPACQGDPTLLKQVWVNLISNAVKYSRGRERARIEIHCEKSEQNEWQFCVRDNGAGFDMRYAEKLFGVFQRLHRHGQPVDGGDDEIEEPGWEEDRRR